MAPTGPALVAIGIKAVVLTHGGKFGVHNAIHIDYVTSEKMDKQIREAGFIPVTNDGKGSE